MTRRKDARLVRLDEHPVFVMDYPPAKEETAPSCENRPAIPDSRSPQTFVIGEATAIGVLIRLYGWSWLDAGILRRPGS